MRKSIRLLVIAVITLTVAASNVVAEEVLKGRDVVAKGTVQSISGTLKADGHEWVLVTAGGDYELHLGPESYRESKGFTMKDGEKAEVRGFVFEKHISPISIKTQTSTIALRTETGASAWSNTSFSSQGTKKQEK
jgi:hypothetical protein